jgi:hypothetical protein
MTKLKGNPGPIPGKTLYDSSIHKEKKPILKPLLTTGAIILMLAAFHVINLTIQWNITKLEISTNELTKERLGYYTFLGLTNHETAQRKLKTAIGLQIKPFTVVSYFDLIHPAVFLIHSRSSNAVVFTGSMMTYPGIGFTDIYFHASEIVQTIKKEKGTRVFYYGNSLFPGLYHKIAQTMIDSEIGEGIRRSDLSFILTPVEDSQYLKIIHYTYFFLPLVMILILASYYGKVFYIAFFYYLGLFLLFDFKRFLFTIPFSWLIDILHLKLSSSTETIVAAVITALFVIFAFIGLFSRKKRLEKEQALTVWGKGLIVFFILLPLVLRF